MTLVSYVPKINKSVLLLSTFHHSKSIQQNEEKKPEIITFYNKTKGGVDTLDFLIEKFTCRRKTNRWPFVVFMNMLDIACYNSFVLTNIKFPNKYLHSNRARKAYIQELCEYLLKPYITERINLSSRNNFSGLQQDILDSFRRCGFSVTKTYQNNSSNDQKKRGRCYLCDRDEDRKTFKLCSECKLNVCKDHSKKHETILCIKCS